MIHLEVKLSFAGVNARIEPETRRELDCQLILTPALAVEKVIRAAAPPRANVKPRMWTLES